jgi:RimJ/RimL family protein N-acetyltransferase
MSRIEPQSRRCKSGVEVVIRTAGVADAARLLEIVHEVMAERIYQLTELDEATRTVVGEEEFIQACLDHPGDIILVAEAAGQAVGLLDFKSRRKRKWAHTGEFGMSMIPPWRDKGIGRLILEVLIDWAAAHPMLEKVDLGVFATNARAIHLYQSLGFVEEGRRKKAVQFTEGEYDDLILMSRFVDG